MDDSGAYHSLGDNSSSNGYLLQPIETPRSAPSPTARSQYQARVEDEVVSSRDGDSRQSTPQQNAYPQQSPTQERLPVKRHYGRRNKGPPRPANWKRDSEIIRSTTPPILPIEDATKRKFAKLITCGPQNGEASAFHLSRATSVASSNFNAEEYSLRPQIADNLQAALQPHNPTHNQNFTSPLPHSHLSTSQPPQYFQTSQIVQPCQGNDTPKARTSSLRTSAQNQSFIYPQPPQHFQTSQSAQPHRNNIVPQSHPSFLHTSEFSRAFRQDHPASQTQQLPQQQSPHRTVNMSQSEQPSMAQHEQHDLYPPPQPAIFQAPQPTAFQAQQPDAVYQYPKIDTTAHVPQAAFQEDSTSQSENSEGEDFDGEEEEGEEEEGEGEEGGNTDHYSETMQQDSEMGNAYDPYVENEYDPGHEFAAEGESSIASPRTASMEVYNDGQAQDYIAGPPVFNHGTFEGMSQESNTPSRRRQRQEQRQAHRHVPTITPCPTGVSKKYRESRYAGGSVQRRECDINNVPIMVPTSSVSSAVLAKRGITHGVNKMISKRGYGANDPENIRIVNMREQLGLDFAEIRLRLNKERIAKGKDPNLSNSGVANRYNRTAPVLFSASGMSFVPLNERGNMNGRQKVAWSDKNDNILVACVKEFEAKKWAEVAAMFNERSGQNADDECVSSRYTML